MIAGGVVLIGTGPEPTERTSAVNPGFAGIEKAENDVELIVCATGT